MIALRSTTSNNNVSITQMDSVEENGGRVHYSKQGFEEGDNLFTCFSSLKSEVSRESDSGDSEANDSVDEREDHETCSTSSPSHEIMSGMTETEEDEEEEDFYIPEDDEEDQATPGHGALKLTASSNTNNTVVTPDSSDLSYYIYVPFKFDFPCGINSCSASMSDDDSTTSSITMSSASSLYSSSSLESDFDDDEEEEDNDDDESDGDDSSNNDSVESDVDESLCNNDHPRYSDDVVEHSETSTMNDLPFVSPKEDESSGDQILRQQKPQNVPPPAPKKLKRLYSRCSLTHCSSRHKFLSLLQDKHRRKKIKTDCKTESSSATSEAEIERKTVDSDIISHPSLSSEAEEQDICDDAGDENDSQMLDRIMQLALL